MALTIEKLRYFWPHRNSVFTANPEFAERVDQIFAIVEHWKGEQTAIETMHMQQTPNEAGIPTDHWPTVKQNFQDGYNGPQADMFPSLLTEIEDLLHIASRRPEFRISSNADCDSKYETENTAVIPKNPESYYASHNWPFEISQYYLAIIQEPNNHLLTLRRCAEVKFVRKFLWMLAKRETVVPIFSLKSYYALAPLFPLDQQDPLDQQNVAQDVQGHRALTLSDFTDPWNHVSSMLSKKITDRSYDKLTPDEKKEFAKLIFTVSLTETTTKNALDMLKTGCQAIILYGPPGTGKTYQAQEVVKTLLNTADFAWDIMNACKFANRFPEPEVGLGEPHAGGEPIEALKIVKVLTDILLPGCWELIQFHPTYSYHDFIGGIMPKLTGDVLGYVMKEGIFKRFCDKARENQPQPFVLIIDEINRAELSSVFGELMYALEYRNREINILHFGPFVIPDNVYVIGTMNSADKSLVTFDLALRRRFLFFKLIPDMSVLLDWNAGLNHPIHEEDLCLLINRAKKLNEAVIGQNALSLPEDYGIGQAYFMKIVDFCVEETSSPGDEPRRRITTFAREQLWTYHLEPLLEEYLGAEAASRKAELKALRERFVS